MRNKRFPARGTVRRRVRLKYYRRLIAVHFSTNVSDARTIMFIMFWTMFTIAFGATIGWFGRIIYTETFVKPNELTGSKHVPGTKPSLAHGKGVPL